MQSHDVVLSISQLLPEITDDEIHNYFQWCGDDVQIKSVAKVGKERATVTISGLTNEGTFT